MLGACVLAGCALLGAGNLVEEFAAPKPGFSPVPIWWWSGDAITREGISDQLEKMAKGGIHNAIILNLAPSGPLYGSRPDEPPFLTEAWWSLFGFALEEAKRNGIALWFYDQLGFSGSGLQARLVRAHPEFRAVNLDRVVREVEGPATVTVEAPPGSEPLAAFVARRAPDAAGAVLPAQWIWDAGAGKQACVRYFRREFEVPRKPSGAVVRITCDNGYIVYINGKDVGREKIFGEAGWGTAESYDIAPLLEAGANCIAIEAENLAGEAGLLYEVVVTEPAGSPTAEMRFASDSGTKVAVEPGEGWQLAGKCTGAGWRSADELYPFGAGPWGNVRGIGGEGAPRFGTPIAVLRNVTEAMTAGGITAEVPAGPHQVQLYYLTPGGFDYQNAEAGAALIDVVHGEMERRFAAELGKGIAGSFQDEFPALPRFSRRLPEAFERETGYAMIERLPMLWDDVIDAEGPSTAQVRVDVNRVAARLCEEAFFIPLHEWHERHNMLCGYDQTVRNADPIRGEKYYLDYFATQRHYSVPGNDMDGNTRPHASIAALYDRPRVWAEVFHSSGWGQTMEEIAVLLHPWLRDGATLFNPHAIYYSIHGSYWEWAPPDTGWRQPYFAHYGALADYTARLCHVLSQGEPVIEVGLLHPATTVHAYTGYGEPDAAARAASEAYWQLQQTLDKANIDFLILDEDSIARAKIEDGRLRVGRASLRAVLLPAAHVLRKATAERLAKLGESGGFVRAYVRWPEIVVDAGRREGLETLDRLQSVCALSSSTGSAESDVLGAGAAAPATAPPMPALHRRIGDRDFYFVMSDPETKAVPNARFTINDRELWATAAAKGERLDIAFDRAGVPEFWDATRGTVTPVYPFSRKDGSTAASLDLSVTPAPLVSVRPATPADPVSVETDFEVTALSREGDAVRLTGYARPGHAPAGSARVVYEDAAYSANVASAPVWSARVDGPFASKLVPTCDNGDGSFAWPPSEEPIAVETRAFAYRPAKAGDDPAVIASSDAASDDWSTVLAGFGARAEWCGPVELPAGAALETLSQAPESNRKWHPAVYSLRLGIDEDPVFASALGGKGRIPEEFIATREARAGEVYLARAFAIVPEDAPARIDCVLRVGGVGTKRVFLNGVPVPFAGNASARTVQAPVTLARGANRIEIAASRSTNGPIRLFYQFLPAGSAPPDADWIWSAGASPTGRTRFARTVHCAAKPVRGELVVALGDIHRIFVNDALVADQGNFDPYFTSRAERYDIGAHLVPGDNTIAIVARDTGAPTGLMLDALVHLEDGTQAAVVSDAQFTAAPDGGGPGAAAPAIVLPGPAQGYMGDPANLLLYPRPHPLPLAGWLQDQPAPPPPFDRIVHAASLDAPAAGWYRFRLPPGATALRAAIAGEAALYVDGAAVPLTRDGDAATAALPEPAAEVRVAALRIAPRAGFEGGAALLEPIAYEVGAGTIGAGSWRDLGLPHYSGGLTYSAEIALPDALDGKTMLDLGRVRGAVDVSINGMPCGVRIWHPYRFDVSAAAKPGVNRVDITVYNTLGPHFDQGHPSQHVYKGHTDSGLFGPVTVEVLSKVALTLARE